LVLEIYDNAFPEYPTNQFWLTAGYHFTGPKALRAQVSLCLPL